MCVIQCGGWTVRDICDVVVADAAVCERDPARYQRRCDGHAAASNVDGSDCSESIMQLFWWKTYEHIYTKTAHIQD